MEWTIPKKLQWDPCYQMICIGVGKEYVGINSWHASMVIQHKKEKKDQFDLI